MYKLIEISKKDGGNSMEYIDILKESIHKVTSNTNLPSKSYTSPDIPDKVINNAGKVLSEIIPQEYIVAIIDNTLTFNGKTGIYFSGEKLVFKEMLEKPKEFELARIKNVEIKTRVKKNKKLDYNIINYYTDTLSSEEEMKEKLMNYSISESMSQYINAHEFAEMINRVIEANKEKKFSEEDQTVPLEGLNEHTKLVYSKILCNYAYSDDETIDSKEYADIITFVARISLASEERIELRSYMSDINLTINTNDLVDELVKDMSSSTKSLIKQSLIKDVIALHLESQDKEDSIDNRFILNLSSKLGVENNELALFVEAHEKDRKILEQRLNDNQIKKTIKDLSSKAASVGVPMAALYLSGTAGVSAIGMTSGLATLGLGGMLGFSSMFTGVGVLALLGITSYQGMKKLTGLNDEKNNKHREVMLQEIIKNNQKTLHFLIEDVNTISTKLLSEIKKSEMNSIKIEKLGTILKSIVQGSEEVANRVNHYESENTLMRAPQIFNKDKLIELTESHEKFKYREIILSNYEENDEGELELKYNITKESAEILIGSLEEIGYFKLANNATATVKSTTKNFISNFRK